MKKKLKSIFIYINLLFFTGCQNLFNNNNNIARNLNSSMKPLVINIVNTLYPFLAFIGLIILAVAIHTSFIQENRPGESPVGKIISASLEFFIAFILISAKQVVSVIWG